MNGVAGLQPRADRAPIELEADVDANRADRRRVAAADADAAAQPRQVEVRRPGEDIPSVYEHDRAEAAEQRRSQLRIEHDLGVAPLRKPGCRNRLGNADR